MKKILKYIIPFSSVCLCSLLLFTSLEDKTSGFLQRFLPSLNERSDIIMVNVDDASIENIGVWPLSREVYAEAMVELKDAEASDLIFDLSFLDRSQAKIDEDFVKNEFPYVIGSNFENLNQSIDWAVSKAAEKSGSAEKYKKQLLEVSGETESNIHKALEKLSESQDDKLSKSLKFYGNDYLTLVFNDDYETSESDAELFSEKIALKGIISEKDTQTKEYKGVQGSISDFLENCAGSGFVNAAPDKDGYMRRVNLFSEYNGNYYGQLVLPSFLRKTGNPQVVISKNQILIKDAKLSEGVSKDIKIRRDRNGSVILKFPKKKYEEYNSVSLWNIYRLRLLEKNLTEGFKTLEENGYLDLWEKQNPAEIFDGSEEILKKLFDGENEKKGITYVSWKNQREKFLSLSEEILDGNYEKELLKEYSDDGESAEYIESVFSLMKKLFDDLKTSRKALSEKVKGSTCIMGLCTTGSTDTSLNQYEENYPNPGVHYTLLNQLYSGDFPGVSPAFISVILSLVLSFLYVFLSMKIKSTGKQIASGGIMIFSSLVLLVLWFRITGIYIGSAVPLISLFLTFVGLTILNLITTSKDKKFIKSAFSQCLSPDVVEEIVKNPSSFKLGGQNVEMTAFFTDIQKFSGFSELLSAEQLVALLNFYLTEMSDIIMEEKGTVDKYEGDAIVAFFGAPVKMKDHALHACRAAYKMKKAEKEMNAFIEKTSSEPKKDNMDQNLYDAFTVMVRNGKKLFTRIGLNSGEIVAGYMGSTNKKNYTMMGNNVNLASRLEGVNKQYHTGGILMSGVTRKELDESFVVRSLDRVQVMNVVTPVRLFELLSLREDADEKLLSYVSSWEKAMKLFESGSYNEALEIFRKLSSEKSEDGTALYYVNLLEKFFTKGKYPAESDDAGVVYNSENPEGTDELLMKENPIKGSFRLLQK